MTTAQNLVDLIRERSDIVGSYFITDAMLLGWLNASLAELHDLLVGASEDYQLSTATGTITSSAEGSNNFNLPADFYKCRGLDRDIGGRYTSLRPFSLLERNEGSDPRFVRFPEEGDAQRYRIGGSKCWIIPASAAPGTYRLWYAPRYSALSLGSTVPDHMDLNSWHEYAVADCGIKVLQRQDLDPSVFMSQKQALQARILTSAKARDASGVKTIKNTRFGADWDGYRRWR